MKNTKYIRSGNVVVTLHFDKSQGTYKVGYYVGGQRTFRAGGKNKAGARKFAQDFADKLAAGTIPASASSVQFPWGLWAPQTPMTVDEVVEDLLALKASMTTVAKSGGGILPQQLTSLQFAGRLLVHLHGGRHIHTITEAELRKNYADLANGKIDLTPIYDSEATHRAKPGKRRNPVTVNTYFRRMNTFFTHARSLRVLPPGNTSCWLALAGTTLESKTSQKPYTPAEIARLMPLLERQAPILVRPVVLALDGVRWCEFACLDRTPEGTGYLYLTREAIRFGKTLSQEGWVPIDTGYIRIAKDMAKKARREGKGRHVIMSPFAKAYLQKYEDYPDIISPLRWRKVAGKWIQTHADLSRMISRFIDDHQKELGFSSRRNGFRHLSGSVRPVVEPPKDAAVSMGHSAKIGKDYYDHGMSPMEILGLNNIRPLPGPALPPGRAYGEESMRREQARKSTLRGGNVPLADSGALLMAFQEFYKETCGTSHGWKMRLAQLLECSNGNVSQWWASLEGARDVERAPSRVYVERLQALLADRKTLAGRLNRRNALLEQTALRISKIEPSFQSSGFSGTFAQWLAKALAPVRAQITQDWIQGRRPASETHLTQLDRLIAILPDLRDAA
jgi:hypothetical protein